MCEEQGCQASRFGRETHGYSPLLIVSRRELFSHIFLPGSHSSFNSDQTPHLLLNTFHSTALFMTITCPDLLRNPQRSLRVLGMRPSGFQNCQLCKLVIRYKMRIQIGQSTRMIVTHVDVSLYTIKFPNSPCNSVKCADGTGSIASNIDKQESFHIWIQHLTNNLAVSTPL